MDSFDPARSGDAEHLAANPAGVLNAFAPLTGMSTDLPKARPTEIWEPQLPAPTEPPDAGAIRHPKHGAAARRWVYRDATGAPLFAVVRFEFAKGDGERGKEVYPYSYGWRQGTTQAGRQIDQTGWHFKRPAVPVPLYGLDRLAARPDATVLLCEGEKSADAAGQVFPDLVAMAAQGGCAAPEKSDWSAVAGRRVVVWPDADTGGLGFAAKARDLMHEAGAAEVRIVAIVPSEWPDGWDLADDLPPDVTVDRLRELLDTARASDVDGDAGTTPSNVIPMALRKAYQLDELEFATRRDALAKDLGITATDLTSLRRKHFAKMRYEQRAAEKAAAQAAKEEKNRIRTEKAQRAADAKAANERAKFESALRAAAAQAEHRARPVSEIVGTVWPYGIEARPDGLYHVPESDDEPEMWLCAPIEVMGLARDGAGESWGLWLRWIDADQRVHTWAMPNKLIMARFGDLETEMVDQGLRVDPNGQQRAYLRHALGGVQSGARVTLAHAPGWTSFGDGTRAYTLINGESFGSAAEQVVLRSPPEGAATKMTQAGTLDGWKTQVAGLADGNPVAMFCTCAAFTGPLLKPMGESSGGFHIHGKSKNGKTLAQRLGVSALGVPHAGGLLRSWRTTANALESAAEESNDGLLTLDEIHQANANEVVGVVYQLANEAGKSRLNQNASAKRRRTWRTVVVSSGELDVATMAAKAGQTLPAGADIRLPSIPVDGPAMWPNLHGYESATELMAALQKALLTQYGTAFRPFLAKLTDLLKTDRSSLELWLQESQSRISATLPAGADDQVKEVARRFALIALAGELAIDWGILPWAPQAADEAAAAMLKRWIERRGGAGSTEESQHVKLVRSYLSEFGVSRFVAVDYDAKINKWVERNPDRPINSRMGWRRAGVGDAGDEYLISRDGWEEICSSGGADPVAVAKTLKRMELLRAGDEKNLAKKVRVPNVGYTRCYVVLNKIFAPGADEPSPDEATEQTAQSGD